MAPAEANLLIDKERITPLPLAQQPTAVDGAPQESEQPMEERLLSAASLAGAWLVLLLGVPTGVLLSDAVELRNGLLVLFVHFLLIGTLVLALADVEAPHPRLGSWFKLTMGWLGVASVSLVVAGAARAMSGAYQPQPEGPGEVAFGVLRWMALALLLLLPLLTAVVTFRADSGLAWLKRNGARAWHRLDESGGDFKAGSTDPAERGGDPEQGLQRGGGAPAASGVGAVEAGSGPAARGAGAGATWAQAHADTWEQAHASVYGLQPEAQEAAKEEVHGEVQEEVQEEEE